MNGKIITFINVLNGIDHLLKLHEDGTLISGETVRGIKERGEKYNSQDRDPVEEILEAYPNIDPSKLKDEMERQKIRTVVISSDRDKLSRYLMRVAQQLRDEGEICRKETNYEIETNRNIYCFNTPEHVLDGVCGHNLDRIIIDEDCRNHKLMKTIWNALVPTLCNSPIKEIRYEEMD